MVLQSPSEQGTASVDDIEPYEAIDGARVAREPMGVFETVLASWLCQRNSTILTRGFIPGIGAQISSNV
jgi:hypothetical protein